MDRETSAAYLVGVQDIPPAVLEQACRDIGMRARGEYESAWPELGVIRERCSVIQRMQRERRESRRLLAEAKPEPLSPEKWDVIRKQFQAVLRRKSFPK